MKYIIFQQKHNEHVLPVVFPNEVVHYHVAQGVRRDKSLVIVSAGHYHIDNGSVVLSKEGSETLKVGPVPGDAEILQLFVMQGLAGLELNNMLAILAMRS